MNIGEKIKNLRLQKGLTLEELGNRVGVGKSTVRKWETGQIENMRRDKVEKVAHALGVSIDYLFDDNDSTDPNNGIGTFELNDIVNAIESGKFTKEQLDSILFAVVAAKKN